MSTTTYVLIVVGLIALYVIFTFNRLVALRQAWRRAFSDIDVQLKQRHDLVPNLVETVKGYAAHESGVLTQVAQARAGAMRATTVAEKSAAEGALTGALANLFAVAENYPQLKANENFLRLQDELGVIAPGRLADLVILQGDPLRDLQNLSRIDRVVKDGMVFDPAELMRSIR